MSMFEQKEVANFPAYRVIKREPHWVIGVDGPILAIRAGQKLGLDSGRGYWHQFKPNSVASYALEYNEDPIAKVERAKARGEAIYWLTPLAVCLSAHKRDQYELMQIEIGQRVYFEGKIFRIEAARNDNLNLVEIKEEA